MVFFKRPGQEPGRCRFESCLPDKYGDVSLIVQGSGLENHQ